MRKLSRAFRKFSQLGTSDRQLLLECLALLCIMRLGLWLLPFRALRGTALRTSRGAERRARLMRVHEPGGPRWDARSVEKITAAVERAAFHVPAATCLTRALAAQVLLGRHGYACALRLGVTRDPANALKAHAWLEYRGAIILGGDVPGMGNFTPLPKLH